MIIDNLLTIFTQLQHESPFNPFVVPQHSQTSRPVIITDNNDALLYYEHSRLCVCQVQHSGSCKLR